MHHFLLAGSVSLFILIVSLDRLKLLGTDGVTLEQYEVDRGILKQRWRKRFFLQLISLNTQNLSIKDRA